MDIAIIRAGQMYRYYLRQVVVGDGRRPARTPLREAQEVAGSPAGRWMGRGLAALGLTAGEEVTEAQLRNVFGERGRHPYADRIEAGLLAAGESPTKAWKAGALGRRVTVTGVDLVFRPQPTVYLLWALGDEETRKVIEVARERAIERVLEWLEDQVAVIRYGKDGIYKVRPPGGLVAARFRHYEARSGMPLLHDHLMLSVKAQRLDGTWGSVGSLFACPFLIDDGPRLTKGDNTPPPSIELNTFAIAVAGWSLLALLLSVGLLNRALKRHRLRAATFRSSRILP